MKLREKIYTPEPIHPNPLISVVTCTYNSAEFLAQALHSVEAQSYPNIEHIINDSYSTDDTMDILHTYIRRNKHRYPIKLFQTEPHGVAHALNQATEEASGEIIHYLHSDDYYLSYNSLEKVADYFAQHPDIVWLTGNFMVQVKGEQVVIPHARLLRVNPATAISVMNVIHHENTFMRREAVMAYGGFCEDKKMNVEYRIWLRMIQDHAPLIVNDQFVVFIIHKGSTSTGNIIQFSKALGRAFHTQHEEKVFPLIGHYEQMGLYMKLKVIISGVQKFISDMGEA